MPARPLMVTAVLATFGSVLLAGGTSAATAPGTAPETAPAYGPVAVGRALPLVDVHAPVLPVPPVGPAAPMGPHRMALPVGPPGVVGPDSPPAQVRAVQRLLNRAGASLRVDGSWGPATTRAVEAVQARAGLPVDGRVGPRTLALLPR